MKPGTKVSYGVTKGTYAPRGYGVFIGESEGLTLVGNDNPNGVYSVVAVPSDRVAEVKDKETPEEHEARLRSEAAEAAKASKAKPAAAAAAIVVAFVMLAFSAFGAQNNSQAISTATYSYWSGGSTNGASTLSWVIVPAHSSVGNAIALVKSIDATTDKLAAKLQSYKVIETTTCTYTNSTVSIPIVSTNTGTKWDSGTIVIRHLLDDTYEKRTLTTSGGSTNLEVTAASWSPVLPGDLIYKVSTAGAAAFTVNTNGVVAATGLSFIRTSGQALLAGQPGMPILMEIDGTAGNATVNNVTVEYVPGGRTQYGLTAQNEPFDDAKSYVVNTRTFNLERP